jgi:hypothetical protein
MGPALRRRIVRCGMAAVVAFLGWTAGGLAQDGSDQQNDGSFTGIAIVTSDTTWWELFQRPETPHIQGKDSFAVGDRGAVAIIISNAEPRSGKIRVECDITAFDPKGRSVIVQSGACYNGPFGGVGVLHPTMLDLQFEITDEDPAGRAGFEIVLRDVYSGRKVELNVAFEQDTGK